MKKSLYDLTKDDWNTLFPIELVNHNSEWKSIFEKEKENILTIAGSYITRIEHFWKYFYSQYQGRNHISI